MIADSIFLVIKLFHSSFSLCDVNIKALINIKITLPRLKIKIFLLNSLKKVISCTASPCRRLSPPARFGQKA